MSEQKIVSELKVSGHLMTLDPGLYCVFQGPNAHPPNPATGLPGVRISLPPSSIRANGGIEISGFREGGWVSTGNDAALIRVSEGPAQILVTVYQSTLGGDSLPQIQVVRLGDFRPNGAENIPSPVGLEASAPESNGEMAKGMGAASAQDSEGAPIAVTAHIQRRGDVRGQLGEWMGERGSKLWIEGFSLSAPPGMRPEDLEYQAVLGRGWLSPWAQSGQFCGSRRMALPVLGFRVRLRGAAAEKFECAYSATFTDGSSVGPVGAGDPCEADDLAPLEAFQVTLRERSPLPEETAPAVRRTTRLVRKKAVQSKAKPIRKKRGTVKRLAKRSKRI
jgi:hypothetical protein